MSIRALLLLPLLLTACFDRTQPSVENTARPVQVVQVSLAPAQSVRGYAGIIRPRREADIAFRAAGRIIARDIDLGAHVQAGQILARIDPTDMALALRSAAADLAGAEALATQTSADAARSRTLLAQGWTPASTDDAKQAAARAALALARNRLDYAVLKAPTDGVITATLADPGTVVAEGQPVLRLAQSATLEVELALPETALPDAASLATVTLWANPNTPLHASLREVAPSADPKLRTYTARYTIQSPPGWLAIGMSATLTLAGPPGETLARLPSAAVTDRGAGPMVWVVDPPTGRLEPRPVSIRALQQDTTLVTGLREGERVVALGVQKLDPAARVRIADMRPSGT